MTRDNKPHFKVFDDKGEEVEIPSKFTVCYRCKGTGVHDHPEFSNGLSREDFDEDPDFRKDYMAGHYDVRCTECDGDRVVAVPDLESLSEDQKRWLASHYEAMSELRAEQRMRERGIEF